MRCSRPMAVIGFVALLHAQNWTPGPQVATFWSEVDDSDQPYALYVPKEYSPSQRWPLVISLHGAGSNHRLNLRRVFGLGNRPGESDVRATRYFPAWREANMIVASPLARGTMGYQTVAERDVYDVLVDVKKRFSIDEDRVYLTGLSMGGGGTLWLGLTRPDVWAAIAAVCPAAPSGVEALAGNALNLPVKLFQGSIDPLVPAAETRGWQARFEEAGVNSEYVEYTGVRHNAWDHAYKDGAIFAWFEQFRRVREPERVRFTADSYRYGGAYWVTFDLLTPGSPALFDGTVKGGVLTARTSGLDAFTVNQPVTSATVDGTAIKLRRGMRIVSFSKGPKGWAARAEKPGPADKQRGLEGPLSDAISSRHVYVHGASSKAAAAEAAEWSTPRSRLTLSFRVLRDTEFKAAADVADANLVLFGTRETNRIIAELADQLPLHLNPGAADYGLVYVYPVGGRYVVVSSGLPWWTRLDQANRPGLPFIAAPYRTLASFGDFILFRGGLDNVIVEGRFDRNWRLSAKAAEAIRATAAVEVRTP